MTAAVQEPKPKWYRPPKPSEDGTMELADHLRELRYRLIVSVAGVVLVSIVCLAFYDDLLGILMRPINEAVATYQARNPGAVVQMTTEGVTGAFTLYFRVGFTAGLVLSCPVWLYQLWAYIAPALMKTEKKVALGFLGAAIPLFLFGVAVGYLVTPKGFAAMLQFNPPDVVNLNELNRFLDFEVRLLLVFGIAFLLPVVLISLNLMGVVTGEQLGKFRAPAMMICTLFAAIATPSTDAFSMAALALPMFIMYLVSEIICRIHDRRAAPV